MTKFVVYESRDEVLVTTAKNRKEFEAEFFHENAGRDMDNYDVTESKQIGFAVLSGVSAKYL